MLDFKFTVVLVSP